MTINLQLHHHFRYETHLETTSCVDSIIVKVDDKLVEEDDGFGNKIPREFNSVSSVYKWLMSQLEIDVVEVHRYG